MFDTLSDRLESGFASLRGKGKLSEADIDATAREIRIALLEADVALPVVKAFIAAVKERAVGVGGELVKQFVFRGAETNVGAATEHLPPGEVDLQIAGHNAGDFGGRSGALRPA